MTTASKESRGKSTAPTESAQYLALARRYRPVQFEDVIGQEPVTRTLKNALTAGRIHHAYLFTGSRGVGKTTVARILARHLNASEDVNASFDLIEIDGASHTSVDDVRQLRENAQYLPTQGKRKIYIIDEVHMLSTSAFNALLKILEEPPAHVVFIFATTEPQKIPATILSRCQRFDFKRVSFALLEAHLRKLLTQEKIKLDDDAVSLIARAAEGSVRDSLTLLDQVIAYGVTEKQITAQRVSEVLGIADRHSLFELSSAILRRDAAQGLNVIKNLFESGLDLTYFANQFLGHLRDLVVVKTCRDAASLIDGNDAEFKALTAAVAEADVPLLQQLFDYFLRAANELSRSGYPRLVIEMAVVEMAHAEPLIPLGDLMERLEALELRLAGKSAGNAAPPPSSQSPSRSATSTRSASPATSSAAPSVAPSASANAAPDNDSSPNRILKDWRALIEKIEPVTASPYVAGQLIAWREDNAIELAYPADSFELQRANDKKKLQAFTEACGRIHGRPVTLIVRALKPEDQAKTAAQPLSLLQARERELSERRRTLEAEAHAHPITRALVDNFGAKIDGVTTVIDREV